MEFYVCGFINREGMKEDLVCNPSTGEVVLISDLLGNVILTDVNIGSANLDMTQDSYAAMLSLDENASGVIIGEQCAVLLYDHGDTGEAKFFEMSDLSTPTKTVEYDYGTEVEANIEIRGV